MNVLQLLLGQIPEAIYFALFMIFTKRLDKKQILFTVLMIIEYILLFIFYYNLYDIKIIISREITNNRYIHIRYSEYIDDNYIYD